MSKYYTPEIEEFHVGFEFEAFHNKEWFFEEGGDQWVKSKVSLGTDILTVKHAIDCDFIRVKYLDREDIESLGWKKFNGFNNNFCRETYTTYEREDGYLMTIHNNCYEQAYWFYIHNQKDGNEQKHEEFRIKIKNKSELKKVLKMLGI